MKRALLLAGLLSLTATGFADTLRLKNGLQISGTFEGGTPRVVRFRTDAGVQEYDILAVAGVRITGVTTAANREQEKTSKVPARSVSSFGPEQEELIRAWFSEPRNYRNLPPGLARREILPPGLQRQVRRNGTLPPGLQRRVQPLPYALEQQLPPVRGGLIRVVLAGDVILLERTTSRIIDLLRNVY